MRRKLLARDSFAARLPAFFIGYWMATHKIFHARQGFAWRRRRGHYTLESHKGHQDGSEPVHHRMRRFSDGHHSQLIELAQIKNLTVTAQTRSLAPQLALHRRRDIDRGQCFLENLAGELLQIRHEIAENLLKIPSALPDSAY